MKRFAGLLFLVFFALNFCFASGDQEDDVFDPFEGKECDMQLEFFEYEVLEEEMYTATGVVSELKEIIRAVSFTDKENTIVPSTLYKMKNDPPFFGFYEKEKIIVINDLFCTDITRTYVPRIDFLDETVSIGAIKKDYIKDYQSIILLLMKTGIILTFEHTHSQLCLVDESDADFFKMHFIGVHWWATNAVHHSEMDFTITIDRESGVITLHGAS